MSDVDMRREVVRQWGSGRCHVADLPSTAIELVTVFGSEAEAVQPPVVTVCRATLTTPPVIVMRRATVGCGACSRLTDTYIVE